MLIWIDICLVWFHVGGAQSYLLFVSPFLGGIFNLHDDDV